MNDPEILKNFERLHKEQENNLTNCQKRLENWHGFRKDYNTLKERLSSIANELKYDIMIPISKKGFIPGKLVHTNEILVLLGDNWFVEKSSKQACEIIDRRLTGIDTHIKKLKQENDAITSALEWTDNITKENSEFVNIGEKLEESSIKETKPNKLSDSEIKELRRKQQERAMIVQRKINEELKKSSTESEIESEDEIDDENEIQEKIEHITENIDDLNLVQKTDHKITNENNNEISQNQSGTFFFEDLLKAYESNIDRENNQFIEKKLREKKSLINIGDQELNKKKVNWSDLNQPTNLSELDDDDDDTDSNNDKDVEDDEDGEDIQNPATFTINFKHSHNDDTIRNLSLSRDKPSLDNPGDIYRTFFKPKSILKTNPQKENISNINSEVEKKENLARPLKADESNFDSKKAFSGEIVEKNCNVKSETGHIEDTNNTKKISKFKASKLNKD